MTFTRPISTLAVAAALGLASTAAFAQTTDHSAHQTTAASTPAIADQQGAMDKMHEAMGAIAYSGDPDVDFARGMIPHHQGAIDMARAVLEHGKDPDIRKLAEAVITAQEQEIRQLEVWLAAHAPK
jgi:uncharacterized protein (DUF305 family)